MRYQGGKHRLAGKIAARVEALRAGRDYYEPFLGGANVAAAVGGERAHLSDLRLCVVAMWRAAVNGWEPPTALSEDEYCRIRERGDEEDPLHAFAGIGCSWGGKLWGGYARDQCGRDYCGAAARAVRRQAKRLRGATFSCGPYDRAPPPANAVVYCDPPYAGTTGYGAGFDSAAFWEWVRSAPPSTTVLVSESSGPGWAEREFLSSVSSTRVTRGREEWLFVSPAT